MKSTKRKIVALSTAFVMAFALVAAMLPATVSEAVDNPIVINSIDFSVKAPAVGTTISSIDTKPLIVLPDGANYKVSYSQYVKCFPEDSQTGDPAGEIEFPFTVQDNTEYYMEVYLSPNEGYEFAGSDTTLDAAINIEGKEDYRKGYCSKASAGLFVKVKATSGGGGSTDAVPVKEGYADQTVAPDAPITIGFEKDFSKFKSGDQQGKVFIDGNEVPAQYITATEGSTIITVAQDYLKQIGEGIHKMVVKFLDGSEGTANFTISSSATASGTTASGDNSSTAAAAATTKVAAPKTADAIPFAAIAVVFVGASVAVVTFVATRKNK